MYKEGIRAKLRFETLRGVLSIEQLWDLPQTQLAKIVRNLKEKLKSESDDELAFLDDTAKQVDKIDQLKFNIVKDIYITKKREAEELRDIANTKEHNAKIIELIKKKQDEELQGRSVEELEKLLK